MRRALVTGSCGFIGFYVSKRLLDDGWYVVGIDNMNDYYDVRLKKWRLKELEGYRNFRFLMLDIEDMKGLEDLFSKESFDVVVNLAARAGVRYSIENPFVYLSTNATGTLNLLELCRKYGPDKFILASTSSLYAGQKTPFTEDLPVNTPISPYAASKKAAEVMAYSYHFLYGIDVTVLRYFTVYGPAGRPDMSCFIFIKRIKEGSPIEVFGDGSQERDFTYVEDIADGTVKAIDKRLGYEIINLGNNKPYPLSFAIETIEKLLGKKAKIIYKPFHKADMKATWADIRKAGEILGWSPKTDFEDGLRKTVEWFNENWDWLKEVKV